MTETEPDSSGWDHPAWRTLVGTGIGYGVVLLGMFVALFVLPFVLFWAL